MSLIANALARLADISDFNPISNRNLFVDGAKETWSIGVGSNLATTTGGGYGGCVLQLVSAGIGGSGNYARGQAGAAQSSRLGWPRGPNNYGTLNQTVASTGSLASRTGPLMAMRVEDVNYLEGSSITFSVTLQNNGASSITVTQLAAVQNFGTGGSPSANVPTIYPVNWVIPNDGVWRRYSARLDIPTTNGKTMGTSTNGFTQISVEFPVGQTFAISDCFWQAEFCSPQAPAAGWPTAFEYRGQAAEAARCFRYYNPAVNVSVRSNATAGSQTFDTTVAYPQMRAVPTAAIGTAGGILNCTNAGLLSLTANGARAEIISTAAGDCYIANYIYTLDARL